MFAAVMPMSARGVHPTSRLKNIHVRIYRGRKDESIPVESAQSMLKSLRQKNADVELIVYPEAGHGDAGPKAYADRATWDWLLKQRRSQAAVQQDR